MERLRQLKIRQLARGDLDQVVALDAAITGRTRRAYFERRLAAALRQPELHVQFAAEEGKTLSGYALARVLEGEFGRSQPGLRLEMLGVAPQAQSRGMAARCTPRWKPRPGSAPSWNSAPRRPGATT